jgi:hypothetical protein
MRANLEEMDVWIKHDLSRRNEEPSGESGIASVV